MDALLLTLILTLVLDQGAATQRMAARLADGGTMGARLWVSLALIVMANAGVAAALGEIMAALLMPDARLLFLAIALLFGATGLLLAPFRASGTTDKAPLPALLAFGLRRAGENGAFVTAGVVAFTDAPRIGAVGATLGGWAALVPALALGTVYSGHGALRLFQGAAGTLMLCAAIACAVNALHIA